MCVLLRSVRLRARGVGVARLYRPVETVKRRHKRARRAAEDKLVRGESGYRRCGLVTRKGIHGELEAQGVAIKPNGPFQVGDLQVHVADVDFGV